MVRVAVVGVGGWGKNLARNFFEIADCDLRFICDLDPKRLDSMKRRLPGPEFTTRFEKLLEDPAVDAIVLATPAPRHYEMCRSALEAGKDVFVEKPFVLSVDEGEKLVALAEESERVLMVGHLLEYHPVVGRLKEMIDSRELGDIHYLYTQRVNLGTVREDENALWNFAPHDISSVLYLLGVEPTDVSARGQSYLKDGVEDVVFLSMSFGSKVMAHIHVSWLDPHKIRKLTIVGNKKMAVFDDLESTEKLKVYDKGAAYSTDYNTFAEYVTLRFGNISIPHIKVEEPLRLECLHFLECVRTRARPRSDGRDGLRVVKVLAAAQRSLGANGDPVEIR